MRGQCNRGRNYTVHDQGGREDDESTNDTKSRAPNCTSRRLPRIVSSRTAPDSPSSRVGLEDVPWMANCPTKKVHGGIYRQWIGGTCGLNGGCSIVARPAICNWHFTGLNCGPDKPRNRLDDKHFRDWIFVDIIQ